MKSIAVLAFGTTLVAALFVLPASAVTPADYWPHEDGREWSYLRRFTRVADPVEVDERVTRLWFEGTTTAPVGIAAQWLRDDATFGSPQSPGEFAAEQPCSNDGVEVGFPIILRGNVAWQRTAGEVVAWSCVRENQRAWIWLPDDLTPGTTRSLQPLPDLYPLMWVTTTVGGLETATVPAGVFPSCLRVDYLVDYGSRTCYSGGVPSGTWRGETRGFILFAPGVGPVHAFEEFVIVEATGECVPSVGVGNLVARYEMLLRATSTVPAVPASWGSVKASYR